MMDNRGRKHLFTKQKFRRPEAWWLEILVNFGIFPVTLKPGKIHVLLNPLSRAPHISKPVNKCLISFNALDIPEIDVQRILGKYENDQLLLQIV